MDIIWCYCWLDIYDTLFQVKIWDIKFSSWWNLPWNGIIKCYPRSSGLASGQGVDAVRGFPKSLGKIFIGCLCIYASESVYRGVYFQLNMSLHIRKLIKKDKLSFFRKNRFHLIKTNLVYLYYYFPMTNTLSLESPFICTRFIPFLYIALWKSLYLKLLNNIWIKNIKFNLGAGPKNSYIHINAKPYILCVSIHMYLIIHIK